MYSLWKNCLLHFENINMIFSFLFNFRLGGIPLGVIAVATSSVEQIIPADPANLESETKVNFY